MGSDNIGRSRRGVGALTRAGGAPYTAAPPMTADPDDLMCFACGPNNPVGLHLAFQTFPEGSFGAEFTPRREHQGYKGIVHGGFLSLVMDEAMIACLYHAGLPAVSAELVVRLLKPVAPGDRLRVTARFEDDDGPLRSAFAETVRLDDGVVVARARATCRRVTGCDLPPGGSGHAPLAASPSKESPA